MRSPQFILFTALICVTTGMVSRAVAQQTGQQTPEVVQPPIDESDDMPPETTSETTPSIGGMIVSGGTLNVVFFGILGVFSLWAVTVVMERMVNLRRNKLLPVSFSTAVEQTITSGGSVREFQAICEQHDNAASRIFQAGILRNGRPLPEVEKAMEDSASREMAELRAKSRPLSVVGNIAPLVGLLGTVVGMIMAFQISSQEGLGKAERLAEGIYLALMTTAAGLTIAIPCLLFASWFHSKGERFMCDISDCLSRTMPTFAKLEGHGMSVSPSTPQPATEELSVRERFLKTGEVTSSRR